MQIQPQKIYQIILTGLGLGLLVLAVTLNHYHPHNQGIADMTRGSLFKRLGINDASAAGSSGISYVNLLPKPAANADKISDPTTSSDNKEATLPQAPAAGESTPDLDSTPTNMDKQTTTRPKTLLNLDRGQ
ncbi:MAG: hypothetical protein JWO96_815 [Candidatus Saccharibacteria bacterium]|nr:hypothetical protein [Candidatus Saccharibacteria bacterium]